MSLPIPITPRLKERHFSHFLRFVNSTSFPNPRLRSSTMAQLPESYNGIVFLSQSSSLSLNSLLTSFRSCPNSHHWWYRSLIPALPTIHPSRPYPTTRNTLGPSILPNIHSLLYASVLHFNTKPKSHNHRFPSPPWLTPPIRAARDTDPCKCRSIKETRCDVRDRLQCRGKLEGGSEAS